MFANLAFQVIIFFLIFAFATYAFILADPDDSYIGRLCNQTIPLMIFRWMERMIGQKRTRQLSNVMDHALQIIYLIVVLGSWSIVFAYGYPEIEKSKYIHSYHQYSGYVVFLLCMGSWHYACHVEPGSVTEQTMSLFDHYKYDNILYTNRLCPTLHIRKIARSKYDRCTRRHVPRFDHYCGWINQAVGERNYRWFLLFLLVHVCMCCYGTWVVAAVMYGEVKEKDLLNATFYNAMTGEIVKTDTMIVLHYLFMRHFQLCGVLVLMSVMSVMLGMFLAFHLYITSFNMTTNEFFKWRAVKRLHKKMRAKFEKAVKTGSVKLVASISKQTHDDNDGDVGCTGPVTGGNSSSEMTEEDEIINPGPMPQNIYNKGIISNFFEVLSPLSYRNEAIHRHMANAGCCDDSRGDFSTKRKVKAKEM